MKYIEFKVHASRQGVEQLTAMFMSKGIYELSHKGSGRHGGHPRQEGIL